MSKQAEKTALENAQNAIKTAIAIGQKPDPVDILVAEYLKESKTLKDRIAASWFPLVVVTLCMLLLGVMATWHPPVISTKASIQTAVVEFNNLDATARDALVLSDQAQHSDFRVFGAQSVDINGCSVNTNGSAIAFETPSLQALLDGLTKLRIEVRRLPTMPGAPEAQVSLVVTSPSFGVLEIPDGRAIGIGNGTGACANAGVMEIVPQSGHSLEISLIRKAAAALPQTLNMPVINASDTSFLASDVQSGRPECAIGSARFEIVQEIPYLGLRSTSRTILPRGVCLALPGGPWQISLAGRPAGLFQFEASADDGNLVDLDDGSRNQDLTQTYLEVIMEDPDIGMIFGGVIFILTTVWSAAAFLREVVS